MELRPRLAAAGRHLSVSDERRDRLSSRSRSVGYRSDRSDDSADILDTNSQASSDAGAKPAARKRASGPKVRTGCISCKKRHVKCDERKPSCTKCENLGLICEGYLTPRTTRQPSRAERLLLPRPHPAALTPRANSSPSLEPILSFSLPLLTSPGTGIEIGDDDSWYYALFRDRIAPDLSTCQKANLWSGSALRDSHTVRSIRHSILSIGAYARALIDLRSETPLVESANRLWWPASIFNRHREAALSHHARALSYLRQDIYAKAIDSRATLAATLLFIVFENMQGNYHASGNLVRSGIKVLNNLGRVQSRNFEWQTIREASRSPDEIDELAKILYRHSIAAILLPFPHGKYAYHMLFENEEEPSPTHDVHHSSIFSAQNLMLHSWEHARIIWEASLPALGKFYAQAAWRNLNSHYEYDDDALMDQAQFLTRLHEFGSSLSALRMSERNELKSYDLDLLAVHNQVAIILISCCMDPTEMSYDKFTQEFIAVLLATKSLLDMRCRPNRTGFSNEVGILPLVSFVASKCRIHSIRLEALDILRKSSWREGAWDGTSLSLAMTNLMNLEGHELTEAENEHVPAAEERYVWTNMFWDFENRRMTMEFTRAYPREPGESKRVTRVVNG